jgi:hypothetical protein
MGRLFPRAGTWSRLERAYPNISYSLSGIAVLGPCALVPAAFVWKHILDESDFVIIGRDVPLIRREKIALMRSQGTGGVRLFCCFWTEISLLKGHDWLTKAGFRC